MLVSWLLPKENADKIRSYTVFYQSYEDAKALESHVVCSVEQIRRVFDNNLGSFCIFLHKKIDYGFSLEFPPWGDSNEYPQHMFLAHLSL